MADRRIKTSGEFRGMTPLAKSTSQKISGVLNGIMEWMIKILFVVCATWLYVLATAALLKYINS